MRVLTVLVLLAAVPSAMADGAKAAQKKAAAEEFIRDHDQDGDGLVSLAELKAGISEETSMQKAVETSWSKADESGDGKLDAKEVSYMLHYLEESAKEL